MPRSEKLLDEALTGRAGGRNRLMARNSSGTRNVACASVVCT